MRIVLGVAAAATALLVSGCGGDESPDASEENTALAPADEATDGSGADEVELRDFADLGTGMRVRVDSPTVGGDDGGPWLTVSVRVENSDDEAAAVPDVALRCGDAEEGGGYQADSTLSLGEEIPAGSFMEGTLNLLLPGDSRTGKPVPACEDELFILADYVGLVTDETTPGRWTLDEDVAEELDSARR